MPDVHTRPRLAFLGLGWIGRLRLAAVADAGLADIVALADPDPQALAEASDFAPRAALGADLQSLLDQQPDGVVVATPSALHARAVRAALEAGCAVFCQKPLAITAADTEQLVETARRADRLLAVDFSYRFTDGLVHLNRLVRSGALGRVFAVDLTFHNAYGPDKPWFYDRRLSGGGCLVDLGSHLVDFLHWTLDEPVVGGSAQLFCKGRQLPLNDTTEVEDYAAATLTLASGTVARLACSWRLHAGCDARIEFGVFGTAGGAVMRNTNGSFVDFLAERYEGTNATVISKPPEAWGGRAVVDWVGRLAAGNHFDAEVATVVTVARTIDRLYGRSTRRTGVDEVLDAGAGAVRLPPEPVTLALPGPLAEDAP